MDNKNMDNFNDTLKDILTPVDTSQQEIIINDENSKSYKKEKYQIKNENNAKFPVWVEIIIRIIASIVTLICLFLFGWNIASK